MRQKAGGAACESLPLPRRQTPAAAWKVAKHRFQLRQSSAAEARKNAQARVTAELHPFQKRPGLEFVQACKSNWNRIGLVEMPAPVIVGHLLLQARFVHEQLHVE
jgi:hypothetical protein